MATIIQNVVFKNATTKQLYDLYMDPKLASLIAGSPVKIAEKPGSKMEAWGGYITGKILQVEKNRLIVQSWHGSDWKKEENSVFIISLEQKGKNVELNAIHANVPEEHAGHLGKGWYDHYWNVWKQYIAGKPIKRPAMHG